MPTTDGWKRLNTNRDYIPILKRIKVFYSIPLTGRASFWVFAKRARCLSLTTNSYRNHLNRPLERPLIDPELSRRRCWKFVVGLQWRQPGYRWIGWATDIFN